MRAVLQCPLQYQGTDEGEGHPRDHCSVSWPMSLQTMGLASGGQDGAICLWDVLTGSRVSHMYAHRGDVTSLTCTTSCVISSGLDDVISIWDRSSGIKLYSIQQAGAGPRPSRELQTPLIHGDLCGVCVCWGWG